MANQQNGSPSPVLRKRTAAADLIVGIGAAAGGLDALTGLAKNLPPSSGLAIVVVHREESISDDAFREALEAAAPIPVVTIEERMPIRPDTLYVAPLRSLVSINKNKFSLAPAGHDHRAPEQIDHFFHELAKAGGSNAVGIVLSGAGADGTLGIKAISDAGGMTMAQSPQTAAFDSMPRSAAITGVADHILPPEEMPAELFSYCQHIKLSQGEHERLLRESIIKAIPEVAKVLQKSTDHDFRHYKPTTLTRRIQRRLQLLKIDSVSAYLSELETNPDECRNLFRELLIGVTEFFRDKEAFEFLERQVIPQLFEARRQEEQIRIWTAGCSTGQEAYSIAMLVREHLDTLESPPTVRIFATDIDERALEIARQGYYPLGIAEDVSKERLRRFFVKRGSRYQVSKEIRELCVFSLHNLISDPPFSRQDLISCRNLLIYLGSHLQRKIIPLFHYSLRPHGFLFLGPSEGMEPHRELFQQLHPKHRILRRKGSAASTPQASPRERGASPASQRASPREEQQQDLPRLMQRIVLDEFAPKSVVVNDEGNILCASGDVSDFLALSNGTFQNNVVKMARPGLRVRLRTVLREARAKKRQVSDDSASVRVKLGVQQVMLTVQPMPEMGENSGIYLVVFQAVGLPQRPGNVRIEQSREEEDTLIDQLERELHETRDELERTIQDLEAANEELKSSNEELLSMNEELQSTNEELETSKEEVQMANQSLAQANNDLQNLLSSTRIATLFLDTEGCIRNFTPATSEIYRLISTDIGRSIEDLTTHAIDMPALPTNQELVELGQVEHEIRTRNGDWFIRRVSPYRSATDSHDGMVMTFTKVTGLKQATASLARSEQALRESQEQLRFILASANIGTWIWHKASNQVAWSDNLEEIHGREPGSFKGTLESVLEDVLPEDRRIVDEALQKALCEHAPYCVQYRILLPDGSIRWLEANGQGAYDDQGELISMSGLCRDISDRKRFEETLALARQQAESANQSKSEFLANMSHEIRTPMTSIIGYSDILQQNLEDPDDIQCVNTIRRNGEFLLEIINDILDLSRIESGNLEVSLERCQPDTIIFDVVSLMDVRAREKLLSLEVEFKSKIPKSIETDPIRLRQILVNLVGNAVKFTSKGYVRLVVQFDPAHELMRCDIVDTGIGMKPEQLNHIFQPFRQADTSVSRRFGGSGLGLTICERLVEMLGGTISATSKVGEGSVFTFTIGTGSLAGIPMSDARSAINARTAPNPGMQVSLNCRALVVDDRREIRRLAQHYIEEAGGTACVAENGAECIDAVQRAQELGKPFDIVIIDMQMPVMDGYEATRRLRSLGFTNPIIALTAHAMKGDREKSIAAGCDDYATKPIDEPALIQLIAKNTPARAKIKTMEQNSKNVAPASPAASLNSEPSAKGRRLLVVEDNVNLRRVLALTFEKRGHEVRVAPTAAAALEIAPAFRPQVALIDLGLPDMSGLELVALLRKMPEMEGTRLFALSGRDDPGYIARSEEAGFHRHIVKPPDVDALERLFYADLDAE